MSNPQVHTLKERQDSISFLLHTLSKKLENSKTLSSSLPLILSGSTTRKGKSFHTRVILLLFPLKNQKLGKVFSYSHLRIHDFFKEFLVMVFVVCEIRKSWTCKSLSLSLYIYMLFEEALKLCFVEGRLGFLLINDCIGLRK